MHPLFQTFKKFRIYLFYNLATRPRKAVFSIFPVDVFFRFGSYLINCCCISMELMTYRQLIFHSNPFRSCEARKSRPRKFLQVCLEFTMPSCVFFLCGRCEDNECHWPLSPFRMRPGNHGNFSDGRMFCEF